MAAGSPGFCVHCLQMSWETASAKSLPPGGPCSPLSLTLLQTPFLSRGLEGALGVSATAPLLFLSLTLSQSVIISFVYVFNFCIFH